MQKLSSYLLLLQKIFSFIFPLRVRSIYSPINGKLRVNIVNGKKTLEAQNSNYSYGILQDILYKALKEIRFDDKTKNILILGLGGGSVIETIRDSFRSSASITVVDLDPQVIALAKSEFDILRYSGVEIVESDALLYLKNSNALFDLIIIDIFINNVTPEVFTGDAFTKSLASHLSPTGKILFNTMRKTMSPKGLVQIQKSFKEQGLQVRLIEKIVRSNDLIIAQKKER